MNIISDMILLLSPVVMEDKDIRAGEPIEGSEQLEDDVTDEAVTQSCSLATFVLSQQLQDASWIDIPLEEDPD